MAKSSPRLPTHKGTEPGPVGPGNPPTEHRFRKGVSGNPNGRPKKERNLHKLIEAELDERVSATQNGKRVRLTKREVIAKTLVNEAAKGDGKALDRLIKLIGRGSEPDNRDVQVDPAELTRFALRYLAGQPKVGNIGDNEGDGDGDQADDPDVDDECDLS